MTLLFCAALFACRPAAAPERAQREVDPRALRAGAKASGPAPTIADPNLAEAVRQRLANHPGLTLEGIEVDATNGVVTLSGRADSDFEKRQAELAAARVRGVKRVQNELRISLLLAADRDDAELRAELEAAFARDPRIDAGLVGVHVQGGVVTLSGTLPDWHMIDAVLEGTYSELPRAVVNRLERDYRPQRPSEL